jgi:ribosomal protein L16 Arg81 hydroxylase
MKLDPTVVQKLLAPHRVESFLTAYWDKKPLYIPGNAEKFQHFKLTLPVLETLIRDTRTRDRMRVRFVGADNKVHDAPADLDHYSIRAGNYSIRSPPIARVSRRASLCPVPSS